MGPKMMLLSVLIGFCAILPGLPAAGQQPPAGSAEAPTAKAESVDPRVDEILTRLQARGQGLRDIRCRIRLVDDDQINMTRLVRRGKILFMVAEPNALWMVHFEKSEIDGEARKQEWYLFDGRWLMEVQERLKQITRREIVHEGEHIDFFDLETAPFPLPFGQDKQEILRNFKVTLAPPGRGDPKDTDHLICSPKPGSTMARKYEKLEFFVRRDVNLPSRIVVTKNEGLEITTADFPDLSSKSINAGLTAKDFARPRAWKGYEEVVEPLD